MDSLHEPPPLSIHLQLVRAGEPLLNPRPGPSWSRRSRIAEQSALSPTRSGPQTAKRRSNGAARSLSGSQRLVDVLDDVVDVLDTDRQPDHLG
jgi:hypothetical protein